MEISVVATKHIRVAALGRLDYMQVVGIAHGSIADRVYQDGFRDVLQKPSVIVKLFLCQGIELLQPRVTKNLVVLIITPRMCAYQDSLVEDDSQTTGL